MTDRQPTEAELAYTAYVLSVTCYSYDQALITIGKAGDKRTYQEYLDILLVDGPIKEYLIQRWEEDHA